MVNNQKVFLDTSFIIASVIEKDEYFEKAKEYRKIIKSIKEVWTHEGILLEIADWFAKKDRNIGIFWFNLFRAEKSNIKVIKINSEIINEGFELYKKYSDKTIGLTDCISFVVMNNKDITEALTADHHFQQAGFRALLIE